MVGLVSRRLLGTLTLVVALAGLAACGPQEAPIAVLGPGAEPVVAFHYSGRGAGDPDAPLTAVGDAPVEFSVAEASRAPAGGGDLRVTLRGDVASALLTVDGVGFPVGDVLLVESGARRPGALVFTLAGAVPTRTLGLATGGGAVTLERLEVVGGAVSPVGGAAAHAGTAAVTIEGPRVLLGAGSRVTIGVDGPTVVPPWEGATALTFAAVGPQPVAIDLLDGEGTAVAELTLRATPGRRRYIVDPQRWGAPADAAIRITGLDAGAAGLEVGPSVRPAERLDPVEIGLSELRDSTSAAWRQPEFELYRWAAFPDILWIDSRDYATQARFFRRLAFFVEKRGFQGQLLTNEELATRHGWNAHNYRPEGLVAFFNAADAARFPLNPEEELLRTIALRHGIVVASPDGTLAVGEGGILAVSQESVGALRRLLVTHEALHGFFYEVDELRDGSFALWDALPEVERAYWRDVLAFISYEPTDRYLIVNEFQAYLLQYPLSELEGYFRGVLPGRVRLVSPARSARVDGALTTIPVGRFTDRGEAMEELFYRTTGGIAGDPYDLVRR